MTAMHFLNSSLVPLSFLPQVGVRNNISDLENDPFYNWLEDTYAWHVVASAVALYLVGGFPFLVWGFVSLI